MMSCILQLSVNDYVLWIAMLLRAFGALGYMLALIYFPPCSECAYTAECASVQLQAYLHRFILIGTST